MKAFFALLFSFMMFLHPTISFAAKQSSKAHPTKLTGLYIGDPNIWGEQIAINILPGGAMHIISDNEFPIEDAFPFSELSSQGTGLWKKIGPNTLEFAYREHRHGDFLCGSDPQVPENCVLIGYGTLILNKDNTASINIGLKIRERVLNGEPRGEAFDKNIGPFEGLPVTKTSIEEMFNQ